MNIKNRNRMLELAGARPLRDHNAVIREQEKLVVEFIGSLQGPDIPEQYRMKWEDFEKNPPLKRAWEEMTKEYRKAEQYYNQARRINVGRSGPSGEREYKRLVDLASPHMKRAKEIITKALGHEPAWIGVSPFNNRGGTISFTIDKRKVKGLTETEEIEEAGDYTSPSEMRRLMDTAAENIRFAQELMKSSSSPEDRKIAQDMLSNAKALWQSMENLANSRRRG